MHSTTRPRRSPFFYTPPIADSDSLAILHLKRDSLLPVKLRSSADDGYAEGAVTNTRFGSFPHSTLIGSEWGAQIRASKVDTGTRGRKGKKAKEPTADLSPAKKRKSDELPLPDSPNKRLKQDGDTEILSGGTENDPDLAVRAPIEAGSGFLHLLPPTPEAWTSSLDHRTQVVYTPDYSYILQRLRVRPGSRIIEAGAGSGSFTHAAARAIFNGYPASHNSSSSSHGKVYSYEFHQPRVHTLSEEITEHGLDDIIQLTHRDVCNAGFLLPDSTSPSVDAVFLDLPAPWHALKHLSRDLPISPLNPNSAIHLCTFSPCIEQVMATVSSLRKSGWTDISMVEVQHKRVDVRRERVGLKEEGLRGVNATASTVAEAVGRLREVETKLSDFHGSRTNGNNRGDLVKERRTEPKQDRLERLRREADERKVYKEGNLVSRVESEVKTHTSYLVFAVLPRSWCDADELACEARMSVEDMMRVSRDGKAGGSTK